MSPFRLKGVILLVSISIVSAIYVILFSPSYQEQDVNRLIQKPLYEKYKINNIVLDVSLANHQLSSELLDYIHNSRSIKNALSFYITPTSPTNKIEEITISSTTEEVTDVAFISKISSDFNLFAKNISKYLIFEETPELFNFTFEFVHNNPQWNHFYPPVIFLDEITRLNFVYFQFPVILLKRAPLDYRPILDTIWELQHPEDCDNVRVRDEAGCGMGCSVHYIHMSMQQAYEYSRPFVLPGYWKWMYNSPECMDHYMCYWLPIPLGCDYNDSTTHKEMAHLNGINYNAGDPELMIRAIVNYFFLKVNPQLYQGIKSSFQYIDNQSDHTFYPCISVHIRRGDKSGEASPVSTIVYAEAVRSINAEYPGNKNILLLSDDLDVPNELAELLKEDFKVYMTNTTQNRIFDYQMNYYRGLDLLNEVYLAAVCDHFIGTYSSNIGRLIAEIKHPNEFGTSSSLDTGYRLFP